MSPAVGEHISGGSTLIAQAIGDCPEAVVRVGDVDIKCLIDTGAQVSTVTETFYKEHLAPGREVIDVSSYITISASQGLEIPYIGYVELQVSALSHIFDGLGFLIVKDPVSTPIQVQKKKVPGVIRSNVLRDIRKHLVTLYGDHFVEQLSNTVPKEEVKLLHALQLYQINSFLNQETVATAISTEGKVRVVGSGPTLVPARSTRVIQGSVHPTNHNYTAPIERIEAHVAELPSGVSVGAAVVTLNHDGLIPVQVANFSNKDIYLNPKDPIATWTIAELEPSVEFVTVNENHVYVRDTVSNDSEPRVKTVDADATLSRMDIGDLTESERQQLNKLVTDYNSTFSQDDDDIL